METPLWGSIVGWCVTLFAAVLPNIVDFFKLKKLNNRVDALESAKLAGAQQHSFINASPKIVNALNDFAQKLKTKNWTFEDLCDAQTQVTKVDIFAKIMEFSEDDKKIVSQANVMLKQLPDQPANTISKRDILSYYQAIEKVIIILENKGYGIK